MSGFSVGIDVGGTFTDFALLDEDSGRLSLNKRLTTPLDPADATIAGLLELVARHELDPRDCRTIIHATTLVTNAVIERRGARTGLLVTRGFRDLLELAREQRYDIHDLFLRFPPPLVPRTLRLEVDERMNRDGEVVAPLDVDQLLEQAQALVEAGVESIAVCFLHAYANPAHEERAVDALRAAFPDLYACGSAEVVPEIGEYERMCTTACNAYVLPIVARYVASLEQRLQAHDFGGELYLMHSAGGLLGPATAIRFPVRLLESGPAAGAVLAARIGRDVSFGDVIAFDMGGTTAKASVVSSGQVTLARQLEVARVSRFRRGSGLPIRTQVVDLIEIGAGGGSIAQPDSLGLLSVGPRSAGALPGPACYGRGGEDATVTDACVALGYIDPDAFLGGSMQLDSAASDAALGRLGDALAMPAGVAAGVYRITCERMAAAARAHLIEHGLDPRRLPLVAFGGAGPIHAAEVARLLGIGEVIVPPLCGVASAVGLLVAPPSFEYARSSPQLLGDVDWRTAMIRYDEMEAHARAAISAAAADAGGVRIERSLDLRLSGQSHDLQVPVAPGDLTARSAAAIALDFAAAYERRYFTKLPAAVPLLAVTWRLRVVGREPTVVVAPADSGARAPRSARRAWFERTGTVEADVLRRSGLSAGDAIDGPALIEEPESTTVIGPEDRCRVDEHANLRIEIGVGR